VAEGFETVFERMRAQDAETRIEATCREWTEPAESSGGSFVARLCREAIARERGSAPADVGFTGITDARFYINEAAIPTVILGPGSLRDAHTAGESVAVEDLVAAARIYAQVFVGFLGA
jgi:acetylornithine deacetylase/succinyl-diaminopimelate desuccinylase-like protein